MRQIVATQLWSQVTTCAHVLRQSSNLNHGAQISGACFLQSYHKPLLRTQIIASAVVQDVLLICWEKRFKSIQSHEFHVNNILWILDTLGMHVCWNSLPWVLRYVIGHIPADDCGLVTKLSKFTRLFAVGSRKSSGFLGPSAWAGGNELCIPLILNKSAPLESAPVKLRNVLRWENTIHEHELWMRFYERGWL